MPLKKILLSFSLLSCSHTTPQGEAKPSIVLKEEVQEFSLKPYSFKGFLNVKSQKKSYPLSIDLVAFRKKGSIVKMRSIVKLMRESFMSHEYDSDYFPHVDLYLSTMNLKFNLKNQSHKIKLQGVKFIGGSIEGTLRVEGSLEGSFKVAPSQGSFFSSLSQYPIAHNVAGLYQGRCKQKQVSLFLETSRPPAEKKNKWFDLFIAATGSAIKNKFLCGERRRCLPYHVDAKFDFEKNSLSLISLKSKKEKICYFNELGMKCEGCQLQRQKLVVERRDKLRHKHQYKVLNLSPEKMNKNDLSVESVKGLYHGFLFHENRGVYQFVRLAIKGEKRELADKKKWDFLYGSSSLFWGLDDYSEFSSYQYNPRRFDKSRPVFVFDGQSDSLLVVTSWQKNGFKGIWYSKTYGRVGPAEVVRGMPELSAKAKVIDKMRGEYKKSKQVISLSTKPKISRSNYDQNPMKITGWIQEVKSREPLDIINFDAFSGYLSGFLGGEKSILYKNSKNELLYHSMVIMKNKAILLKRTFKKER